MDKSNKKGFLVGKFAPLHKGHELFIRKALEQCDELFIIMSHDQRFLDTVPIEIRDKLHHDKRWYMLQDLLNQLHAEFPDKTILSDIVDETNIPYYPNGWQEFIDLCKMKMNYYDFHPNIVFSSEPSYNEHYRKYLPDCEHVIIDADRNGVPVSATIIRNEMLKLQKEINNRFEHTLSKDVLIRLFG